MKLISRFFVYFGIVGFLFLTACSTTNKVTKSKTTQKPQKLNKSIAWYKKGKVYDKTKSNYIAIGSSISTDSVSAVNKAKEDAKARLNNGIQNDLENLRNDLAKEEGKHAIASKPAFIWLFRNATNNLKNASIVKTKVIPQNGIYQAFVQLKYSKKQVINDLMHNLSSISEYQKEVKQSKAYQSWISMKTDTTKAESSSGR